MTRTFESGPARRQGTRISVGFVGYSGSGKTFSMLRFASGMAEAQGGKTVVVDSNLERSLHYAPKRGATAVRGQTFDFEIVPLSPPHGPGDWMEAFKHALKMGATRIIGDCMSDEWEGDGGVLDAKERMVDVLVERARRKDKESADWEIAERVSDLAWRDIKREHLALRLWMWQQPVHWLLSYRAKEKIDRKNKRANLGWQPIGAGDIVYDLDWKCLLPVGGDGTPIWKPKEDAEKLLVKQPGQFRELFAAHKQVNEELGYQVARWAAGGDIEIRPGDAPTQASPTATSSRPTPPSLVERYDAATTWAEFVELNREMRAGWDRVPKSERAAVTSADERARGRVQRPAAPGDPTPEEKAEIARQEANNA